MRKTLLLVVLLVLSASYPLAGSEFTRMERWQHDELIPGLLYDAVVDKDGVLIAGFQKTLVKVATAKK